jgi:RNA polymerase sigma-70 factor (ECF subfamily)
LLFVCAHPAIDVAVRTPLMLQTVLGLDAARIAAALRVAPKTMGQRLWRAKTKIRDARISFDVGPQELPTRLFAVLEAIYAAYGSGWDDVAGRAAASRGLTDEAIWLARLTVRLLPEEPEARGLLALMLYAEARVNARRGDDGAYIPLTEQDPSRWDPHRIFEAEVLLAEAARMGRVGPLQLEAAIQSAHLDARRSGSRDDRAVSLLYEALVHMAPTLGVRVAHAVALSQTEGPARGLALLDAIESSTVDYQPYWSARAYLLERIGRFDDARDGYDRAAGLAEEDGIRRWLLAKKHALPTSGGV